MREIRVLVGLYRSGRASGRGVGGQAIEAEPTSWGQANTGFSAIVLDGGPAGLLPGPEIRRVGVVDYETV